MRWISRYFREGQFTREYGLIRGFQGLQFLDGLRLNVNNYGIEPYGLERIDVLKHWRSSKREGV
jgi:iron complex outermembrane receptor protein